MNRRAQTVPTGTSLLSRKPLLIGVIVLILVVVLLLFFVGRQFVGKAFATLPPDVFQVGQGGIVSATIQDGDVVVILGANIGAGESVSYEFSLNYPSDLVSIKQITASQDWTDVFKRQSTPAPGTVRYEYGTLDFSSPMTGAVPLATVVFHPSGVLGNIDQVLNRLTITDISVWSMADNPIDLISSVVQPGGQTSCEANAQLCGPFCADVTNRETYCNYAGECPSRVVCPTPQTEVGYSADLNLDDKYNGQDAQVIFGTRDAQSDTACGNTGGDNGRAPCPYDLLYVCDDGSFRVQGLSIYNNGQAYVHADQTCPYAMERGN